MSFIDPRYPNIVQLPASYSPWYPLINPENCLQTPPLSDDGTGTVKSNDQTKDAKLGRRLEYYDQRCLLTGSVAMFIKPTYLIKAIRGKSKTRVALKEHIVSCNCANNREYSSFHGA